MVKTLIFETGAGDSVLVMVGGDQSVKSGLLKKAVGSRDVRMVSPERIKVVTGYEVGSIPPFHWQPEGFRSLLEVSLLAETELGVGAGKWGHEIIISPENLIRAARADVVSLVLS
jgi:Cys-tRNA(Pro)/Cys-tRNA(Cys) deacylase